MEKAEIIQKVGMLLNNMDIKISAPTLDFFYDECVQYILNYCNLYELPIELENTLIKLMVNECYKNKASNANEVNSISEGGRSVSFINKIEISQNIDNDIKMVLNKFKVLYK